MSFAIFLSLSRTQLKCNQVALWNSCFQKHIHQRGWILNKEMLKAISGKGSIYLGGKVAVVLSTIKIEGFMVQLVEIYKDTID